MGKKKSSDEVAGTPPEPTAVASLFSDLNPFRRKPDSSPSSFPAPHLSSPKRKRDTADDNPPAKKPKEEEEEEEGRRTRKKRKRQVVEAEEQEETVKGAEERKRLGVTVGEKRKAEEFSKELVVREEESFDDESKLLRTVFVGNLPFKTKRKALLKEFASFGEIDSLRIRSVPIAETTAPRKAAIHKGKINDAVDSVHAYIVFKDEQSAKAALAHNMAKVGGNHIRVDMACPPRKKLKGEAPIYSVKKTVFVGNLPYDVKDEEIYQLFCEDSQVGPSVEAVRVVRDPKTSVGKGIAYVLFKTREAANLVVKKTLKLRERELRLSHAKVVESNTPSKRKSPAPAQEEFPNKRVGGASGERQKKYKVTASSLSYQGLRASKSGVHKKAPRVVEKVKPSSQASTPKKDNVRAGKRPAVAARKAKALKQGQNKRKPENSTPDNTRRSKKARHFN